MSKLILLQIMLCNFTYAACDWKTGITSHSNGYLYTKECHIEVGRLVKSENLRIKQVDALNESIRLKDLQVKVEVERAQLWRKATIDMEGHYSRMRTQSEISKYVWFGLGVLMSGAAVYGAGRINK